MRLVWRNRKGEKEGSIGQAQLDIAYPSLSPDGSQVAARGLEQGEDDTDVWVHDVMGNTKSRITFHEGHDSRLDLDADREGGRLPFRA
jgi:Tol biopolymer transport system component